MDVILRGATVVDGTRAPACRADVRISGTQIAEVGPVPRAEGAHEIDLSGLVLAPGFIDPHTHYDAQVLWDPDLTPSSWHGVTTVVMGNCGFTLAPTRPDCRQHILNMLTSVEGMSYATLDAGISWSFASYPEYLAALDGVPKRLNVASMIGHSAVRYFVMGAEAMDRPATTGEVRAMREVVDQALVAGAIGFSTSRSSSHVGAACKPVPSRVGDLSEIWELTQPLRKLRLGTVEATWGPDLFIPELAQLANDLDRPVTWAAVLTQRHDPGWTSRIAEDTRRLGGSVYPQVACKPLILQIDLDKPGTLAVIPAFAHALAQPRQERIRTFQRRDWRLDAGSQVAANAEWEDRLCRAVVRESDRHRQLIGGPPLAALARKEQTTALELLLDLAVSDDLKTRFEVLLMNDDEAQIAELLQDPMMLVGLSDAGAHAAQLCDADSPTYLLSHWWRKRQTLSLEDAVWRITGHPAVVFGLERRGVVAPGNVADLVAFDPDSVGGSPMERVWDLPGGADRLVVRSTGIEYVWVGGTPTCEAGVPVPGATPGVLLRNGRD